MTDARAKPPPPSDQPDPGTDPIRLDGFSYLPRFFSTDDATELGEFFAQLHPIWEQRHSARAVQRGARQGRLSRPVYWLGAWQFASLGYYAEPDHLEDRCLRAEPLPPVMTRILERLRPELAAHGDDGPLPNTCLINYYGRTPATPGSPPVDVARLKMHRDAEPGAVVMLSVGQPAQFEFVMPGAATPEHALWVRNRSVVVLSGPEFKDRLYHRVTRVRYGQQPVLTTQLQPFELRRVSVSFRHVPERYIHDLGDMSAQARADILPHIHELAEHSEHYRRQLLTARP